MAKKPRMMGAEPGKPTSCPDHKDRYSPRATRSERGRPRLHRARLAVAEPVPGVVRLPRPRRTTLTRGTAWIVGVTVGLVLHARVLAEGGLRYMRRIDRRGHHVPSGWQRCRSTARPANLLTAAVGTVGMSGRHSVTDPPLCAPNRCRFPEFVPFEANSASG
jgi:hypothetical protein